MKIEIERYPKCPKCGCDTFDDWWHSKAIRCGFGPVELEGSLKCNDCGVFFKITKYIDGDFHSTIKQKGSKMTDKNNRTALQIDMELLKDALIEYEQDCPISFADNEMFKAAKAYADLPSKIEGMKVDVPIFSYLEQNGNSIHRANERNKTLDDIIKILKEGA